MDCVKRIWYLSPMRAAKVQASLRIRAVSPEPPLLTHTSSESRGTFKQKARPLAPLNGWACAVKICHDGMLEDTNSLDGDHVILWFYNLNNCLKYFRSYYSFPLPMVATEDFHKWTNTEPVCIAFNYVFEEKIQIRLHAYFFCT